MGCAKPIRQGVSKQFSGEKPHEKCGRHDCRGSLCIADHDDDRSLWPAHHLSAGFRNGPLQLSLLLLHVRTYGIPAQEGTVVARGTRSGVLRLRSPGRPQIADHRWRAVGAAGRHDAVSRARPILEDGRTRRVDPDDKRQPAGRFRRSVGVVRRAPGERVSGYPGCRSFHGPYPWWPDRRRHGRLGGGGRRGARGQDQYRGAPGNQRR